MTFTPNPFWFCLITSILISTHPVNGQLDSTEQKPKKKSAFGQYVKQTGDEFLRANGLTPSKGSSRSGSSRSSAGLFSVEGNTIRGGWKEYGGGGDVRRFSPRNHTYFFDVVQNNVLLEFKAGSEGGVTTARLYDPQGNMLTGIGFSKYGSKEKISRAGQYKLVVGTKERNQVDTYTIEINGPVSNIRQEQVQYWHKDGVSFGAEGGGGEGNLITHLSPRNHFYTFEPTRGSMFDVNLLAQPNVRLTVFAPDGSRVDRLPNEGEHAIGKANLEGQYLIMVLTTRPSEQAEYKVEVVGTLKANPVKMEMQQQVMKGRWDRESRKHLYTMAVQPGTQEILLRSRTTDGKLYYLNANNEEINPYQAGILQSAREQNILIPVAQPTDLTFYVETDQPTGGEYELLVTGRFSDIKQQLLKTQGIDSKISQEDSRPGYRPSVVPGSITDAGGRNDVLLSGRIRASQPRMNLTTMRVVYEDLETGEQVGKVIPDATGNYSFSVPAGRRYGITVVSDEGYMASSQNVELTKKTLGQVRVAIPIIDVIVGEVGEVINLNNIFFQTGKATLLPQSYAELNRVGKFLKDHPTIRIEIAGHTDSQGSAALNKTLSNDRALSVAYNLQGQQISQSRVRAVGYGMDKPVVPNTTDAGRAQNRRVEFRIVGR